MGRDWSDDILIVKLPAEPQTGDELDAVASMVLERPESDLIVDLGAVDKPACRSLCELMRLSRLVSDRGRRPGSRDRRHLGGCFSTLHRAAQRRYSGTSLLGRLQPAAEKKLQAVERSGAAGNKCPPLARRPQR